ncbi:hypothetical protein B4083_4737 [Bacillus cereus]|nr:hypothetical protein B4083_4737 [Bacillus cereus]
MAKALARNKGFFVLEGLSKSCFFSVTNCPQLHSLFTMLIG